VEIIDEARGNCCHFGPPIRLCDSTTYGIGVKVGRILRALGPPFNAAIGQVSGGHIITDPQTEQERAFWAIYIFMQLTWRMNDKRSGNDRDFMIWSAHAAAACKTEIDLGRTGIAVIRADLTGLPAGERHIATRKSIKYSLHMTRGIEALLFI